ncbi:hypothetical protein [Niveibacterium sp. SC-1]|uniref:hypothetical protein n=1 Tax=Niveibacterium sp. SC-1 TaxID=3135646 RepID=UPI00312007A4
MKNIVIILAVIIAFGVAWQQRPRDKAAPAVASNPVYAETRVTMDAGSTTIEGVMLGQALDDADCRKQLRVIEAEMSATSERVCPTCKITTSTCKTDLVPRYAKLFDNEPTHLSYISLARGTPDEREYRMIYWGLTVQQSEQLCSIVPHLQKKRAGTVRCVHAASL